jgi:hypothetical protein
MVAYGGAVVTVTSDARLDTTPLTVASTGREMREFTTGVLGRRSRWNGWVGLLVLYAVATAAVTALVFVAVIVVALGAPTLAEPVRDHALLLSVGTAACLVATVFSWVAHVKAGNLEELFRLHRFAAANGFDFTPEVKEPGLPGFIFQRGTLRRSSARLRRSNPRPLEVANYSAWIPKGRAGEPLSWSYFALTLDRQLPHVVLASSRSAQPAKDSRTPLSGPVGETFSLYCPPEAERWARSLFTPEVVTRFVGPGKTVFDVEVVEDRLFVYARLRPLSCCDPQTWRWMVETADALYARLDDLDDTGATPARDSAGADAAERGGLAPPYAGLHRTFPVLAVVVPLLVMIGLWVVTLAA